MATTVRIPIDLRAPGVTINAGNAFWTVEGLTAHDFGSWQMLPSVDGSIFGIAHVPKNIAVAPAAKIILILAANSTSEVANVDVLTEAVAPDAESLNPGSLTGVGNVSITLPATARDTKEQSYALGVQPSADDLLITEIFHDGAGGAGETLSVNLIIAEAYLEIDIV